MNHLVIGSLAPFVVAVAIYLLRGRRAGWAMLLLAPLLMCLSALWAVAPDIPRILGRMDVYNAHLLDPRVNIFYWHYSLDQVETDSLWPYAAAIGMLAFFFFIALREIHLAERKT